MLLGSAVCDGRGRWLRIRRHMALLVRCRSMWIRRYAVRLCLIEGLRGWGVRFSVTPGWCGREAQAQQQHRVAKRHMVAMCARFTAVVEDMTTVQHGCRGAVQQPVPRSRRAGRWLASARDDQPAREGPPSPSTGWEIASMPVSRTRKPGPPVVQGGEPLQANHLSGLRDTGSSGEGAVGSLNFLPNAPSPPLSRAGSPRPMG